MRAPSRWIPSNAARSKLPGPAAATRARPSGASTVGRPTTIPGLAPAMHRHPVADVELRAGVADHPGERRLARHQQHGLPIRRAARLELVGAGDTIGAADLDAPDRGIGRQRLLERRQQRIGPAIERAIRRARDEQPGSFGEWRGRRERRRPQRCPARIAAGRRRSAVPEGCAGRFAAGRSSWSPTQGHSPTPLPRRRQKRPGSALFVV